MLAIHPQKRKPTQENFWEILHDQTFLNTNGYKDTVFIKRSNHQNSFYLVLILFGPIDWFSIASFFKCIPKL